jgi:hypothetical protein
MYFNKFWDGTVHTLCGMTAFGNTHVALVHPGLKYGSPEKTV